jgi:hypothetical protein
MCQPFIPLGDLEANLGLRVVLRQQRGSLPPSLGALVVDGRVPTFRHRVVPFNLMNVSTFWCA